MGLLNCCKYLVFLMGWGVPLMAQTAAGVEDAAAKQRSSAAAMQESLAKQRDSVHKQMASAGSDDFFQLPRPASLGGVSGAVAATASLAAPISFDCDPLPDHEVDALVGQTAERDGVNADLLRGVMKQESGFRPCAVSAKGAMGLMQLMPGTAEQLGIGDPFDTATNVDGGARFLKQLLEKYGGDVPKALGAYNAGPSKVDAAGTVPSIPETVEYVRQILAALPFH